MHKALDYISWVRPVRCLLMAVACVSPFASTSANAAVCTVDNGRNLPLQFQIPSNLTAPRDAPIGTVIYESPVVSGGQEAVTYVCTASYRWGLTNSVGGVSAATTGASAMPIGNTGLAWSLVYIMANSSTTGPTEVRGISLADVRDRGTFSFKGASYRLRIKKIGSVAPGATVEAGLLGYVSVNNDFNAYTVRTISSASVEALSCKTPSVAVRMGNQNRVGQFKGVGTSLAPVNFSIALNECPEGINKASYSLKPTTALVDGARGVVALDASSTAKGVGVQILDEKGAPVPMNERVVFNGYSPSGGNFSIPLKAAYYQTAPNIVPGTANSAVTFMISYD